MKKHRDVNYSQDHAIERFQQRYGVTLSPAEYQTLTERIREMVKNRQNITGVKRMSKTNTQYVLSFQYKRMIIIPTFETERNVITTFLPVRN